MPWHFLFESLAYIVAFRLYLWDRNKRDFLDSSVRWSIVVAAIGGAAIGSKLLFWFEDPARTLQHWNNLGYLLSGKTIIGALLGGTAAVEWAKRRLSISARTGDLFAVPIAAGIAIGRIGCFFAGLGDKTYGVPTGLPWGIDFGDGVRRHPVQLYETAAMLALILLLRRIHPPRFAQGDRFRAFLLAYFGWRLFIDFWKPGVRFGGLSILQWSCAAAIVFYLPDLIRMLSRNSPAARSFVHG